MNPDGTRDLTNLGDLIDSLDEHDARLNVIVVKDKSAFTIKNIELIGKTIRIILK